MDIKSSTWSKNRITVPSWNYVFWIYMVIIIYLQMNSQTYIFGSLCINHIVYTKHVSNKKKKKKKNNRKKKKFFCSSFKCGLKHRRHTHVVSLYIPMDRYPVFWFKPIQGEQREKEKKAHTEWNCGREE